MNNTDDNTKNETKRMIAFILKNSENLEFKDKQVLLYNLRKRKIATSECGSGTMINLDRLPLRELKNIYTFIKNTKTCNDEIYSITG